MSKRLMPVKTSHIELDGEYRGWWVDVRTNPPVGRLIDTIEALQRADEKVLSEVMLPVYDLLEFTVNAWNFVDEKGKGIPATRDGFKSVPIDLLMILASKVQEAVAGLPLANSGG